MRPGDASGAASSDASGHASGGVRLDVAWLRAQVGDAHRRPWRLTPARLAAYAAAMRALVGGGAAVEGEDPGGALDPDRQAALRPAAWPLAAGEDPADVVAAALGARPATAAVVRAHQPLDDFAGTHVALQLLVPALALLAGDDPTAWRADAVRAWLAAHADRAPGGAEFADGLLTLADRWALVDDAFAPPAAAAPG